MAGGTARKSFIEQVRAARFSFLLVAKPEDHISLYQDLDGLRRGRLLDHRCTIDATGDRHEYEWVTGVPLNGNPPQSPDQLRALPHRTGRHAHLSKRLGDRLGTHRWQLCHLGQESRLQGLRRKIPGEPPALR